MKNLSISNKLIIGFSTILIMLLITIGMSVTGINGIYDQIQSYAKHTLPNNTSIWMVRRNEVAIQRDLFRAISQTNPQQAAKWFDSAAMDATLRQTEFEKYASNQIDTSNDTKIAELRNLWNDAGKLRLEMADLMKDPSDINIQLAHEKFDNDYTPIVNKIVEILVNLSDTEQLRAVDQEKDAVDSIRLAWLILAICGVSAVILSVILTTIIRKSIITPVNEIMRVYKELSEGHTNVTINYDGRDEIGQMASLIQKTNSLQNEIIKDIIDKFAKISHGDLQIHVDLDYPGDYAILKQTIEETVFILNETMSHINTATEQVTIGSNQVSSGAQALASGSTEQAASIEELAASIEKITAQVEDNAITVKSASKSIQQSTASVIAGNEHMHQLTVAMADINSASNQIAKITKVIEDIAFQTNILSLNAAIEAARAGNAGKGFAVVADEVRNLAAKSAEAAKQTNELIQTSVATVSKGMEISNQTAKVLQEVGVSSAEVTNSFGNIEQSFAEQVVAIEQIKDGISQISAVVQTNAATAEENSATSEEMAAQAISLREEVSKFKLADEISQKNDKVKMHSNINQNILTSSSFNQEKY